MGKHWTPKEMDTLREMYATTHIDEICAYFGKSRPQIYDKAKLMKLQRPTTWRSKHCPWPLYSVETQFKKGHTAWNKGMKGIDLGGKETRFKKGQVPHNKLPPELRELTKTLSRLKKNINEKEKRNAKKQN